MLVVFLVFLCSWFRFAIQFVESRVFAFHFITGASAPAFALCRVMLLRWNRALPADPHVISRGCLTMVLVGACLTMVLDGIDPIGAFVWVFHIGVQFVCFRDHPSHSKLLETIGALLDIFQELSTIPSSTNPETSVVFKLWFTNSDTQDSSYSSNSSNTNHKLRCCFCWAVFIYCILQDLFSKSHVPVSYFIADSQFGMATNSEWLPTQNSSQLGMAPELYI